MDDAELTCLPGRVGQMSYEPVRALFDENRAKMEAHRALGEECPYCLWLPVGAWPHCPEQEKLWNEREAQGVGLRALARAARQHERTCQFCISGRREWREWQECSYLDRLSAIDRVAARRLSQLKHQERVRRFEQAYSRAPERILELVP